MTKRFIVFIALLAVAIPIMAQQPGRAFRMRPRLRERQAGRGLNLTPDQRNTLKSLMEANKAQRQAIMQDVKQRAQLLRDLTSQANPNPTDVGNAVLALKQARSRGQQLRQQTMDTFRNSLTPEQQKKIDDLQARRKNRRGRF